MRATTKETKILPGRGSSHLSRPAPLKYASMGNRIGRIAGEVSAAIVRPFMASVTDGGGWEMDIVVSLE